MNLHRPCTSPLFLVLAAATCGCRSAGVDPALEGAFPTPLAPCWDEVRLGPNDVMQVGVYGHPELSTSPVSNPPGVRVDPAGDLSLPLVGAVHVGGSSLAEAREAIQSAFATYVQDPRVDVSVVEYASRRFYLYGEVDEPGPYVLDRPLTIYQGLTLGGGFRRSAGRSEIVHLRIVDGRLEVRRIDGERLELAGLEPLRAEDFLFVRRSRAGEFSEELLPILSGLASSLTSVATVLLIEDRLKDG